LTSEKQLQQFSYRVALDDLRLMSVICDITGKIPFDCVRCQGRIIAIIINPGDKNQFKGPVIGRLRFELNSNIKIIEWSNDIIKFTRNLLEPVQVKGIELVERGKKKILILSVDYRDRARVIGKNRRNLAMMEQLLSKYYTEVKIFLSNRFKNNYAEHEK